MKPSEASVLWMEAGAMSGGSRNQIEFAEELSEFFLPALPLSHQLTIVTSSGTWTDRPLTPKTTTFGVDIWRLSLPTTAQCGMRYPDRVIRFERVSLPRGKTGFRLAVADHGSETHLKWKRASTQNGFVGTTSGDREYGLS